MKRQSLLITTGRIDSESAREFTVRLYANAMLEKGEVHYVDLSDDDHRFQGLLPECNLYKTEDEFHGFMKILKWEYQRRLDIFKSGYSLEEFPYIYVFVMNLRDEYRELFQTVILEYLTHIRAIKSVLIVKGYDTNRRA